MLFYLNKTPFPAFPQRGRSSKTFPPWGKMKGSKKAIIRLEFVTEILKYNTAGRCLKLKIIELTELK
jgi:hypothetical protein